MNEFPSIMPPEEKQKPPAKKIRWHFWGVLIFSVSLILSLVPALAHMGPTREGECRISQESIEWLAKDITAWEKSHPNLPPVDLDDIQKNHLEQKYAHAESGLFMADLDAQITAYFDDKVKKDVFFGGVWLGRFLQHPESHLHREPPKQGEQEARVSVLFRFSRGRDDEPKELHSWERTSMDEYMRFAKRKEITEAIAVMAPIFLICAFVGFLGAIMINGLISFIREATSGNKT